LVAIINHPWDFYPRETGATSLRYNVQRVTMLFPWARFDKFAHRIFLTRYERRAGTPYEVCLKGNEIFAEDMALRDLYPQGRNDLIEYTECVVNIDIEYMN